MRDKGRVQLAAKVVNDAIAALFELAGAAECDQGTVLDWLIKQAEEKLKPIKERLRSEAVVLLGSNPTENHVSIQGTLGTAYVVFTEPHAAVRKHADMEALKELLGDKFKDFFDEIPVQYKPVKSFEKVLTKYEGAEPVKVVIGRAVSFDTTTPRVNFPKPPNMKTKP